ncbi:MAG: hypothetical protein PHY92_06800 [Alphaproteobacteria bacterium]|nr:hypothetical protein [Alphaproteobacteria bacterium]
MAPNEYKGEFDMTNGGLAAIADTLFEYQKTEFVDEFSPQIADNIQHTLMLCQMALDDDGYESLKNNLVTALHQSKEENYRADYPEYYLRGVYGNLTHENKIYLLEAFASSPILQGENELIQTTKMLTLEERAKLEKRKNITEKFRKYSKKILGHVGGIGAICAIVGLVAYNVIDKYDSLHNYDQLNNVIGEVSGVGFVAALVETLVVSPISRLVEKAIDRGAIKKIAADIDLERDCDKTLGALLEMPRLSQLAFQKQYEARNKPVPLAR